LNYARTHLSTDFHFQLDADEILHEKSYDEVRKFVRQDMKRSAIVTRWNFWRDHRHTIPEGHCLGKHVIRIAPTKLWMASDGVHHLGSEVVRMGRPTGIEIFHYGFIRKRAEFFKKERQLQDFFFASYDKRLEAAEQHSENWMDMPGLCDWNGNLADYGGEHPKVMKGWLEERGMK